MIGNSTTVDADGVATSRGPDQAYAAGDGRFDRLAAALSSWLVGGPYLAGVAGLLLSYLPVPPGNSEQATGAGMRA